MAVALPHPQTVLAIPLHGVGPLVVQNIGGLGSGLADLDLVAVVPPGIVPVVLHLAPALAGESLHLVIEGDEPGGAEQLLGLQRIGHPVHRQEDGVIEAGLHLEDEALGDHIAGAHPLAGGGGFIGGEGEVARLVGDHVQALAKGVPHLLHRVELSGGLQTSLPLAGDDVGVEPGVGAPAELDLKLEADRVLQGLPLPGAGVNDGGLGDVVPKDLHPVDGVGALDAEGQLSLIGHDVAAHGGAVDSEVHANAAVAHAVSPPGQHSLPDVLLGGAFRQDAHGAVLGYAGNAVVVS